MKYHGCIIRKVSEDLGDFDKSNNHIYEIWKDGKFINHALTLSSAKEYIDSGFNENYL